MHTENNQLDQKVVFYLMELTVSNARILYNECQPHKKDRLSLHCFQLKIINRMCKVDLKSQPSTPVIQCPVPPKRRCDPAIRRHGGFHLHKIALIPATARKKGP